MTGRIIGDFNGDFNVAAESGSSPPGLKLPPAANWLLAGAQAGAALFNEHG
jgi:hypothetical protein